MNKPAARISCHIPFTCDTYGDDMEMKRQLTGPGATIVGVGSMIGAGLFASFGPAASAAGGLLYLSLAIAAFIAFCNAASSAQLAAQYPTSGGTYMFGRAQLGHWWGFIAGWCFLIGKTASLGAMALTFGHYAAPDHSHIAAVAILIILAAINHLGIKRTAAATAVILTITLISLAAVLIGGWSGRSPVTDSPLTDSSLLGVLQGAGLLFFAFAGYARLATLGEEVKDPQRTIPRAIITALTVVLALYALVAFTLVTLLGTAGLAGSSHPLADIVDSPILNTVLTVGVSAACAGSLLGLMAGIGRTGLAMARDGDLPRPLSAVHRRGVPHRIDLIILAITIVLVLFVPLGGAIGFSSFGVLLYYSVTNASAFTQQTSWRRYPKALQVAGFAGCLILAFALPLASVLSGLGVVAAGIFLRLAVHGFRLKA